MNKSDSQKLEPGSLMRRLEPASSNVVSQLSESQVAQLHRLAEDTSAQIKGRRDSMAQREKPGNVVLFTGPGGTGKTMAVQVLAGELGAEIFRIDTPQVVSRYIGETEKNLDVIFTSAANSNAILFFDEADALFGKRSDVKDSHDRYANLEVNALLQRAESYPGLVVLACNRPVADKTENVRHFHLTQQ